MTAVKTQSAVACGNAIGGVYTGKAHARVMLSLKNIEKGIDKSWLLFCLTVFLNGALTMFSWQTTYIFEIKLSLASDIRVGVKSGLYADSEAANVHSASNPACLKSQRCGDGKCN